MLHIFFVLCPAPMVDIHNFSSVYTTIFRISDNQQECVESKFYFHYELFHVYTYIYDACVFNFV